MERKVYTVSGFDCAVCAGKVEAYVAKHHDVSSCHMDFTGNKFYIYFKDKAWSVSKLTEVIKEVEDDPLFIAEAKPNQNNEYKIMNKTTISLLIRIIVAVVISLVCIFALAREGQTFTYIRFGLYTLATILIGYDVFIKVIIHLKNRNNILDHNLLITIAALGATILAILSLKETPEFIKAGNLYLVFDESMEAVMVITLFQIGKIVESIATNKSKAAVMAAVELRVEIANKVTDEGVVIVKPEDLVIGDKVLITTGEVIPIDGKVIEGDALIDTSSLTGEFVPVVSNKGLDVYSGCTIKSGSITIEVSKKYEDSAVSKIIEMISNGGEEKSKADEFIAKFAKWYTPIVVVLAVLTFLIGAIVSNWDWMTWVHTGLEVLVIGCPCAIVISVPLAYFSAIGLGSKNRIVIKGANYLDKLCELGVLVTDKTGTLTHGSFSIQKVNPIGMEESKFMEYLFAAESLSKHPIGKAITHKQEIKKIAANVKDFEEISGLGVKCTYKKHKLVSGGERMLVENNISFEVAKENGSVVYLSVENKYCGYVVLSDEIKQDAQPMVDLLHNEGVDIVLLTGDHDDNARAICKKLGIDRWHSELLPEDKTKLLVQEMENTDKAVAFVGDGINDAPSIIRSDIGIAMGGIGSGVAVQNADIVIMNDDPAKIYDAIKIAKIARNTSIFNIVFALTIKLAVFILAIIFKDKNWMMYVAILADTGLTVLLVINSLLLLYRKINRPKLEK